MKIDWYCTDGSPLGIVQQDIFGEIPDRLGVGGSELAMFNLCNMFTDAGHQVTLYNNPRTQSTAKFEQRNQRDFHPKDDRDILIIFRTANLGLSGAKGYKIFYTHDQQTMVEFPFKNAANFCQKIIGISPFHVSYLKEVYNLNAISIDLPVNVADYEEPVDKIPYRCLFSSVPGRGLQQLREIWDLVVEKVPEASLVITSDYRLWNSPAPLNEQYRKQWIGKANITFKGAIRRRDLIREQLQAQLLTYPCTYQELFCYAVAEAQVAGTYPITDDISCLGTTNMGCVLPGEANDRLFKERFISEIVHNLQHPDELKVKQEEVRKKSIERFSFENVMKQWDELVFKKG